MSKQAAIEEPLRTLRSRLLLQANESRKCFLVTSARDGDGKTTICGNLGQVLASSGLRVLLIDANLRHSTLHSFFGVSNDQGLLNVLRGDAEFQTVAQDLGTGLSLLPGGVASAYQEPLLLGENFDRLLKVARERYDIILVDSPPVLSWSDVMLLAPRTDGVVVVLRAGASRAEDIRLVREQLESAGAQILGSVLNSIPRSPKSRSNDRSPAPLGTRSAAVEVRGLGLTKSVPTERSGR